MIKKICFYIFLFFCLLLNIVVDTHIKDYFKILEKCFGDKVVLTNNLYAVICVIFAFISILIVTDILLVLYKKEEQNKGINFKTEDGTFGTANWMNEKEVSKVLGTNNVQGIILGKYNNEIVKLPFESYFNKNICVFGSSGSMKTIRLFTNKPIRTI
jgi:type IV secretory pathway TraG/TraD family ATPase VirD4